MNLYGINVYTKKLGITSFGEDGVSNVVPTLELTEEEAKLGTIFISHPKDDNGNNILNIAAVSFSDNIIGTSHRETVYPYCLHGDTPNTSDNSPNLTISNLNGIDTYPILRDFVLGVHTLTIGVEFLDANSPMIVSKLILRIGEDNWKNRPQPAVGIPVPEATEDNVIREYTKAVTDYLTNVSKAAKDDGYILRYKNLYAEFNIGGSGVSPDNLSSMLAEFKATYDKWAENGTE